MKKIILIALLVAAGCSKKGASGGSGGECEAAMAKGTDSLMTTVKTRANPQMMESVTEMVGKMKSTLTTRCTEDKWSPESIDCFSKITSQAELRACEQKLTEEQRNKLRGEMRALMGSMRPGAGHPPTLGGSAAPPAPGTPPAGEPPPAAAPPATGGTAAPAAPATPPAAGSGSSASGW
ncbi:MAG TPA: hypothetical protein VLM79_22535 [Kofleriaceae bacterium]|nr:hypothetical protein [Kofleriaceae bacterium]